LGARTGGGVRVVGLVGFLVGRWSGSGVHGRHGNLWGMPAPQTIRIAGDPVLRRRADEVTDIDGELIELTERMFQTMYSAPGIGLAAPQVGVGQRFFIYDLGDEDGARVLLNPEITGGAGEWEFAEGCLSVPGQHFDLIRPKQIGVRGIDLDGTEVEFEADELLARLIQHELDHLDGILLLDHLEEEDRREAKRILRELQMGISAPEPVAEPKKSMFRFR
jgi:peptide deformylase